MLNFLFTKPTNTDKLVDIIVRQNSATSSITQQFQYDAVNTPIITSITPNTLSVLGNISCFIFILVIKHNNSGFCKDLKH